MKIDIQSMSDNELVTLKDQLVAEFEVRQKRQKEEKWQIVREAIAAYIERFGPINICNDYDIDKDWDLTTPGEIRFFIDLIKKEP